MKNEVLTVVGEKSGDCGTCLSRVLGERSRERLGGVVVLFTLVFANVYVDAHLRGYTRLSFKHFKLMLWIKIPSVRQLSNSKAATVDFGLLRG